MKKNKIWIIGLVVLLLVCGLVLITCDWLDGCPKSGCKYPEGTDSEREVCSRETCERTEASKYHYLYKLDASTKCNCE